MKNLTKIIALALAVLCICLGLSGCTVKYNATVLDTGIEYTAGFLKDSMTYGGWYINPDYDPEDETSIDGWYDETSPETRVYILRDKDGADGVFAQSPEFDFEKKTVIVYCWTAINVRKVVLKTVKKDKNGILKISFTLKKARWGTADTSMPQRRILAIELDKTDFSSVQFTKIN